MNKYPCVESIPISYESLERELDLFKELVKNKSHDDFFSFHSGLPYEWEGYKTNLYNEGQRRLGTKYWKEEHIGTGKIAKRIIDAIDIVISKNKLNNNLVDWRSRDEFRKLIDSNLKPTNDVEDGLFNIESTFFNLYKTKTDYESVFQEIVAFTGKKYPLVAYFFFLKDIERFLPIAPKTFDKAFEKLNIPLVTSRRCSYENYFVFLDVVKQIRTGLRELGYDDTSLIDAHSFCWLLVNLGYGSSPEPPKEIIFKNIIVDYSEPIDGDNNHRKYPSPTYIDPSHYVAIQERNIIIGRQSEELVIRYEKDHLIKLNRPDLAEKVKDYSRDPSRGYDVESYEEDGTIRLIEVKTSQWKDQIVSFYVSPNQIRVGKEQSQNYYFYLVSKEGKTPIIHCLAAKDLHHSNLEPIEYRARVAARK